MTPAAKGAAGSAVLHAGAVAGLLLLARAPQDRRPIVVDLTLLPPSASVAAPGPPGAPVSPSPSPRRVARLRPARAPAPAPNPGPAAKAEKPAVTEAPAGLAPATAESPVVLPAPGAAPPAPGGGPDQAPGTGSPGTGAGTGAAASEGGSGSAQQIYLARHYGYIREAIQRGASYPPTARRMGWTGRVILSFRILLDGAVSEVRVVKGSGFELLDTSAVKAVRRASPFPRPPAEAEIIAPVTYVLE